MIGQAGKQRGQQVDLDTLADAGAVAVTQRGQYPGDREETADDVDKRNADLLWLAVRARQ